MNKMHVIHMLIWFIYYFFFESGRLLSGMSTVWEETDDRENKYSNDLAKYLMTVLSYSYVIIMDFKINALGHGNNFVDGLNATEKSYLKGGMELMGKLASNDTTILGCLPVLQNMSPLNL